MAAYAALLSLMQTIHHIQIHPRPPLSFHQKHVNHLTDNITFLQNFLERYSSEEDENLESRITAVGYAAEDVIETEIVEQIHIGSTSHGLNISSIDFCQGLERVIRDMDLIKKEMMKIISERKGAQHYHQFCRNSSVSTATPRAASSWQSNTMAGFDDVLVNEVLDKLTGQHSNLQIISIVGMGGIGKTTFARYIYANPHTLQHFDFLYWVTISQEYSVREILSHVLSEENKGSKTSENELGERVHKHLWGRRYLVVMDDIWCIQAWDQVKSFFPDNNNRSRIMITTRLTNLAFQISGSIGFQMKFLSDDKSWNLLRQIVFGGLDCPTELENIGQKIARKCKGLPLSIVVIGGLLRKSNMTQEYWEYTLKNLNLLVNLENNEHSFRILRTSYKELPIHLKPCFLYLGIFPEDDEINVSMLIKLWVAEGILRPVDEKSLEEVAVEYLKDLIDRNLILVAELRWNGEAKICKIHDLLRDVCLREAQNQKFICLLRQQKHHTPLGIRTERRICINADHKRDEEYSPELIPTVESLSLTRSLLYRVSTERNEDSPSPRFGLLRVYSAVDKYNSIVTFSNNAIFEQANLRYLSLNLNSDEVSRLPSLCSLLWNLQTLQVDNLYSYKPTIAPSEIWKMPLLRHVMLYDFVLPDPPDGEHDFALETLQTLSRIMNFKFSEEVVKRIPNVKKLKVKYERIGEDDKLEGLPNFCLNNLVHLQKLESLNLRAVLDYFDQEKVGSNLVSFPISIKKLSLHGTKLNWEELTIRVGSLPLLQVLRLSWSACTGPKWITVEGQFCSLKFLRIDDMDCNLKYWQTDSTHFPCLEHLHIRNLKELEEIPSSIGDIPTLKSIRMENCNRSGAESANRIKEEQEENGNEDLQVIIDFYSDEEDQEISDEDFDSDEEDQVVSSEEKD